MGEERQLELEFCELHRLFRATVPRCASAWQPVELQAGSSLLALFWRHVGWFDGFEGALTRPDDEAAPAELSAMLEQWRTSDERGDGSYDRVHELLPARYRVISLGDETVTLADETGGELDPPVAVLYGPSTDAEGPGLERLPQNYLATVTALLLESVQFETVVKGTLTVRGLLRPEVLPSLLPGSVCLDEACLLACSPPSEPTLFELRASSVAQVVELLKQIEGEVVGFALHSAPVRRARQLELPASLRRLELGYPMPCTLYFGELAGAPVLVTRPREARDPLEIRCDSAHVAAVDQWFASNRP